MAQSKKSFTPQPFHPIISGMGMGKDYKKGDPVRGAAILIMTMEKMGRSPAGVKEVVKETLRDLGVTQKQVETYIREHFDELVEYLKEQGVR